MFDIRCEENAIERRLTKNQAPVDEWAGREDEQDIKEATVKRCHYDSHQQLEAHLADFIGAYNFGRRLKTLKGPIRVHLQKLDDRARKVQTKSDPSMPGL